MIPARGIDSLSRVKRLVDELAPARARAGDHALPRLGPRAGRHLRDHREQCRVAPGRRPAGLRRGDHAHRRGRRARRAPLRRAGALAADPQPADRDAVVRRLARRSLLSNELLPVSDRLVIDTGRCAGARELGAVCRMHAVNRVEIGDLGWLRLAGIRLLFAGLFDPPVGGGPLAAASHVEIEHRGPKLASALLLAAWLGVQLGWRPLDATPGVDKGTGIRLRFAARQGQRRARAHGGRRSAAVARASAAPAASCRWRSNAGGPGETYRVRRTADNHAELTVPIAPPRTVKLDSRTRRRAVRGRAGPGRARPPAPARAALCRAAGRSGAPRAAQAKVRVSEMLAPPEIIVVDDAQAMARLAGRRVRRSAAMALSARGTWRIALAGRQHAAPALPGAGGVVGGRRSHRLGAHRALLRRRAHRAARPQGFELPHGARDAALAHRDSGRQRAPHGGRGRRPGRGSCALRCRARRRAAGPRDPGHGRRRPHRLAVPGHDRARPSGSAAASPCRCPSCRRRASPSPIRSSRPRAKCFS